MNTEERIARLERQVRRQRAVFGLAGLVFAGLTLGGMAQDEPEWTRHGRIIVKDLVVKSENAGGAWANLTSNSLTFHDTNGRERLLLGSLFGLHFGGGISVRDAEGRDQIEIGDDGNGIARVTVYHGTRREGAEMSVHEVPDASSPDSSSAFRLFDSQGRARFLASSSTAEGNGGSLTLHNQTGQQSCSLAVDEEDNGVVSVRNPRGGQKELRPGP